MVVSECTISSILPEPSVASCSNAMCFSPWSCQSVPSLPFSQSPRLLRAVTPCVSVHGCVRVYHLFHSPRALGRSCSKVMCFSPWLCQSVPSLPLSPRPRLLRAVTPYVSVHGRVRVYRLFHSPRALCCSVQ